MKKILFLCAMIFACQKIFCQVQNDFSRGEELFKQNQPEESLDFLQKACDLENYPKAYIYLSLAYYQLGNYEKSLEVCEKGMTVSGTDKKVLAFNAGNTCYAEGNYKKAEEWFSKSIMANPAYANPVLNRANSRLMLGNFQESKADYVRYLELAPNDSQKEQIEKLILLLDQEIARIELEKEEQAAEEARLKEEEERLAEEMRIQDEKRKAEEKIAAEKLKAEQEALRLEQESIAKEEAERRRKLLEDVASSLQNTETENMSAGAEGTFDYGYETELE